MEIHPQFKLNGISLTRESLYEVAYSLVKEGKDFEVDTGDFLLDWLSPTDSVQVNTSGSTGMPKTIGLRKENMVNSALATGRYFQLEPKDTALLCLSARHIAGKMMLVRAMVLGMWITAVEPTANPLEQNRAAYDFAAMVPMQVQNSMAQLHRIEKLIVGGAPISPSLKERLAEQPSSIYETYGMTETITHIAVKQVVDENDHFETLPGVNIKKDERGCLVIHAPQISSETITTNDLVEIRDKTHFKWVGRFDNVINSGGVKLIPERIEEKLAKIISNRFFVAGIPDEALGQKLILMVEGKFDLEAIKVHINHLKGLSKYERPKEVFSVPKFMETDNGKINRNGSLGSRQKS